MSQIFVKALATSIALLLAGCAGAPQQHAMTGDTDATTAEVAVVGDIEGEFQAALQLMKAGEWQAAAEKLAAITATRPELSGPWTNLGIARNNTGDMSGAELAFKRAIDTNAGQIAAYNELGIIYRRSGRLEEAAGIYNEGLKISPNDENMHWNIAILYDLYLTNPAQALFHYERFQQLTQSEDRQLLAWISELREQTSQLNVADGAKQ